MCGACLERGDSRHTVSGNDGGDRVPAKSLSPVETELFIEVAQMENP